MFTRRWFGLALCAVALALLCVRLGFWQWHRMEHKKEQAAQIERHLAASPVPLRDVVRPGHPVADEDEWLRVTATGHFDADHQVTVKFTTRAGTSGADVVTPLVLDDGTAVLVDRGWLETPNTNEAPSDIPEPPRGQVTISGWIRPDNRAGDNAVVPVDGQVRAISSHGLQKHVGRALLPGFVNLQEPTPDGLQTEPRPHVSSALNFFYALQWWFFAGLALIGPFWFGRANSEAAQASEIRSA